MLRRFARCTRCGRKGATIQIRTGWTANAGARVAYCDWQSLESLHAFSAEEMTPASSALSQLTCNLRLRLERPYPNLTVGS